GRPPIWAGPSSSHAVRIAIGTFRAIARSPKDRVGNHQELRAGSRQRHVMEAKRHRHLDNAGWCAIVQSPVTGQAKPGTRAIRKVIRHAGTSRGDVVNDVVAGRESALAVLADESQLVVDNKTRGLEALQRLAAGGILKPELHRPAFLAGGDVLNST